MDDLAGLDGRIEQLLASLDPLARQVAEMRFVAGVPQDEISTRLDLPPATVSSILRGALETMRHELDGQRGLAESQ